MKTQLTLFLIFNTYIAFSQNPIADFQVNIDYKCGYATPEYINNSVNADTFLWDVNGTGHYIETYEPRGSNIGIDKKWKVTLIAKQNGLSDTLSKEVEVFNTKIKFEKKIADTNLFTPLSVDFINTSEIREGETVTYSWDFGDGLSSTQINPIHIFESPNTYYLTLTGTISNGCELSYSDYVIVKDTAQKGEFDYIICDCSGITCDYGKNHIIERYTYIINELAERSDSIIFSGIMVQNCCTEKTATLREKNDTVFIRTWEVGPQCCKQQLTMYRKWQIRMYRF
jgi:PKD repeat protein